MRKISKLMAGVLAVALVLSMSVMAFADETKPPEADSPEIETTDAPLTEGETGGTALDETVTGGGTDELSEGEEPAPDNNNTVDVGGNLSADSDVLDDDGDENPDTGVDNTMLKVCAILVVVALAGILITTRQLKKSKS